MANRFSLLLLKKRTKHQLDQSRGFVYNPPSRLDLALFVNVQAGAGWQNGYAEDCKSSYVGSIPASASTSRPERWETWRDFWFVFQEFR